MHSSPVHSAPTGCSTGICGRSLWRCDAGFKASWPARPRMAEEVDVLSPLPPQPSRRRHRRTFMGIGLHAHPRRFLACMRCSNSDLSWYSYLSAASPLARKHELTSPRSDRALL